MPAKQPVLFTFHKIREQCEQGDSDAWRAFLSFYGPLWLGLLDLYISGHAQPPSPGHAEPLSPRDVQPPLPGDVQPPLPGGTEAPSLVMEKLLADLSANNFERFRATARQSEREFLADVRAALLDIAEGFVQPAADGAGEGEVINSEKVGKLLEGLPLMHQEMLFFKLAGYTDGAVELMLRVSPHVAEKAFERLPEPARRVQAQGKNRCPWPAEWLAVLREARAAKTESCTDRHQLLRIHDGQVSWYDKEPAEKHVASCLHCLESWTAVREVTYWRRAAPPVSARQVDDFLGTLPLAGPPKKSLLSRVFGT
jgi:hypothetical protein